MSFRGPPLPEESVFAFAGAPPFVFKGGSCAASRNSPCRRSFLRLSPGCSPGPSDVVCRRPWGSSVARNPFLPLRVPHPSFLRVGPVSASRNSPCRRSFLRLSPGSPGRSDVVCRRPWGFSHHHISRAAKACMPSVSQDPDKVVIPRAALARGICFSLSLFRVPHPF